jgi:hypothetical protein
MAESPYLVSFEDTTIWDGAKAVHCSPEKPFGVQFCGAEGMTVPEHFREKLPRNNEMTVGELLWIIVQYAEEAVQTATGISRENYRLQYDALVKNAAAMDFRLRPVSIASPMRKSLANWARQKPRTI